MKTIGILYICTGPYALFWEDFYKSFQKNFLPNTIKKYFVFTDVDRLYSMNDDNVKIYPIKNLPWPLITLFRFDTFLSAKSDLIECDYLMFSNANMICSSIVSEEEFLPDSTNDEVLFFTDHPGYYKCKMKDVPYERRSKSLAYIPYNCGEHYVIGALFGGETNAFLDMSVILKKRIEEDLKKNIIARWHDESHINRYIIKKNNIKYLSPSFCYPVGFDLNVEKKIAGVSKQDKFDVKSFKGQYDINESTFLIRLKKVVKTIINKNNLFLIRDNILHKDINEVKD